MGARAGRAGGIRLRPWNLRRAPTRPWGSQPASVLVTARSAQRPHQFLLLCPPRLTAARVQRVSVVLHRPPAWKEISLQAEKHAPHSLGSTSQEKGAPGAVFLTDRLRTAAWPWAACVYGSSWAGVAPSVPFIRLRGVLPRLQP